MLRSTASKHTLSAALVTALAACGSQQAAPTVAAAPAAPAPHPTRPAPPPPPAPAPVPPQRVQAQPYGDVAGQAITAYTLRNAHGLIAKVINYGATLLEMHTPDRDGKVADVARGFDNLAGYLGEKNPYFGATIGRVANRTRAASFTLDGAKYELTRNLGKHHLHGGEFGWDKAVWNAEVVPDQGVVIFTHTSPDGDQGYPGAVKATVIYELTDNDELRVSMSARTDKTTPVNMAHHSYWNLGGPGAATIEDHVLTIRAERYAQGDVDAIPTGEVKTVENSVFDFREPKRIGDDLRATGGDPVGYDHTYLIEGEPSELRPFARLEDPASGRVLELWANQAALQFYTGNFMDGTLSGRGAQHTQYSSLCLESEAPPNAINVDAWRQMVLLQPGTEYHHVMVHKFSIKP